MISKTPPANAGDARKRGSILELGEDPGEGMATPPVFAWRILYTRSLLNTPQFMGCKSRT